MSWKILFKTENKTYRLAVIESVEIDCSVDNLVDVATITLPESVWNDVLNLEGKIKRGSEVLIQLGYDDNLETEFIGFVQKITNDGSLIIHCEDALFLFRTSIPDVELKPTSVKKIAEYVIKHVDSSFTLSCDYDIAYEKFTIHQATGYDVLKKLQEETKGNFYFDTENKVLHIHPPYVEKGGDVVYSMHLNVESSSLEYKEAVDKRVEIVVEKTDVNGKVTSVTKGTTGGDRKVLRVGNVSDADLDRIADAELLKNSYDGYEGSFDTWLVPFVKPSYSALIIDRDYPHKKGKYYVVSVKTSFSSSGGKRTITPGIKLSI
ncbi:MAG: hypothetical protein AB7D46_00865 [Flavobacteriaceae bacterium]